MNRMPKFRPGDRIVIARGEGVGIAGTVCAPQPGDPASDTHVRVQFDREPGTRYWADVRGLAHEPIPKKPARPSVRRQARKIGNLRKNAN